MTNIILKAVQEGSENRDRIEFMKMWLDKIVVKEIHMDGIRQRNITIALAIFAGLFSFRLQSSVALNSFFATCYPLSACGGGSSLILRSRWLISFLQFHDACVGWFPSYGSHRYTQVPLGQKCRFTATRRVASY